MNRVTCASLAVAIMAGSALSADYNFPSHAIPGNVPKDQVKQIVSFVWDDNAYSGLAMSNYETAPGQPFAEQSWVGGKKPWGATAKNELELKEGDFGMSWAIHKLAGREMSPPDWSPTALYKPGMRCAYEGFIWESAYEGTPGAKPEVSQWGGGQWKKIGPVPDALIKKNPDGTPLKFTFNIISGMLMPIYGPEDGARESEYGYWAPNKVDMEEWPHLKAYENKKIAICWGREMPVRANTSATGNVNGEAYGLVNEIFKTTQKYGHEIGNHTVDHMESNTMMPKNHPNGFGRFNGEGFMSGQKYSGKIGSDILGWYDFSWDESEEFGRRPGISWHSGGWIPYAGRQLSKEAWKGVLMNGEYPLVKEMGWKPARDGGIIKGFRAPRLEVNSNHFFALAELGYLYDTGLEDGLDDTKDGTNYVWPYTMENGSPNTFTMRKNGYTNVAIDSLPVGSGLWEYPVSNIITHPNDRSAVYDAYVTIAKADGRDESAGKKDWMKHGKITGYDFNLLILWGMTGPQFQRALEFTLDQSIKGNKSPMQLGVHTDYFSPIYDNATLASDKVYKEALKFNKWQDRLTALEKFVDYALKQGAYFYTGEQTINYVKELLAKGKKGDNKIALSTDSWTLMKDGGAQGTETIPNLEAASVTMPLNDASWGGYYTEVDGSKLKGLTHIELEYTTNAPLFVTLEYKGDKQRQVLLNNLGVKGVKSGLIPYEAFEDKETGDASRLEPSDIVGIAISPQVVVPATGVIHGGGGERSAVGKVTITPSASRAKDVTLKFSAKNIAFHVGTATGIKNLENTKSSLALNSVRDGAINLTVGTAGTYSVSLHSTTGRLVKSLKSVELTSGKNSVAIGNVPAGMYIVNISGSANKLVSRMIIQ